ncbi:MAG: hypothetical protein AABW51_02940 [Nanoarchaeota archaeon]
MVEETTFRKLKKALLEMMRGYPEWGYYGKLQYFLPKTGDKSVDLLIDHEIIEELSKEDVQKLQISEEEKKQRWYRLKPRGVDLAISMINLEYSERVLKYTHETSYFTKILIWFTKILVVATVGMLIFAFAQALITLWF